jgi:hypothetical protein
MPAITYYQNIPQATDLLSTSQSQILTNFGAINTFVGIDHIVFSDATNPGKHDKVTLPVRALPPATVAGEIALYSKAIAGVSYLFYRQDGLLPEFRLTGGSSVLAGTGYTILPAGLQMVWGNATVNDFANPDNPVTVNFPTVFPAACFGIWFTMKTNPGGGQPDDVWMTLRALTKDNFTVYLTKRDDAAVTVHVVEFYYFAIGI